MATEELLREREIEFLQNHQDLAKIKTWTPSILEVSQLVISRINDKYAGVTPNVEESVELVFAVLKSVHQRLQQPSLWK